MATRLHSFFTKTKQQGARYKTSYKSTFNKFKPLTGLERVREGLILLVALFSIYLTIALISFQSSDPAWSQSTNTDTVTNITGRFGAFFADLLLVLLGYIAYLFPLFLILFFWSILRRRDPFEEPFDLAGFGAKLLGAFLFILASCILAALHFDDMPRFLAGGVIGDIIGKGLIPSFSLLGSTIIVLFIWAIGFTLLTGLSWLHIIDGLGGLFIGLFMTVRRWLNHEELINEENLTIEQLIERNKQNEEEEALNTLETEDVPEEEDGVAEDERIDPLFYTESSELTDDSAYSDEKSTIHERIEPILEPVMRSAVEPIVEHSESAFLATTPIETIAQEPSPSSNTEMDQFSSSYSISSQEALIEPINSEPVIESSDKPNFDFEQMKTLDSTIELPKQFSLHSDLSFYERQQQFMEQQKLLREKREQETQIRFGTVVEHEEPTESPALNSEIEEIEETQTLETQHEDEASLNSNSYFSEIKDELARLNDALLSEASQLQSTDSEYDSNSNTKPEDDNGSSNYVDHHSNEMRIEPEDRVMKPHSNHVEETSFDTASFERENRVKDNLSEHIDSQESMPQHAPFQERFSETRANELPMEEFDDENEENSFLETIAIAKQEQLHAAGLDHPFLMRNEPDLPVPTTPLPPLELLDIPDESKHQTPEYELEQISRLIEEKLLDYKISVTVVNVLQGPVITSYELDLAPGIKASRITGLASDLARALSVSSVRVVEVIPGKPYIGLELPNKKRDLVSMYEVAASETFQAAKSPISVVLGKDISGEALVTDLAKTPHLLVAGTTGSGKSVGVNVMIMSMLLKATPEEVRFIMIDPKMLELYIYEGIPHLLTEVVTDMKDANNALRWCVGEMERRYKLMSALGVRNLAGYNEKIEMAKEAEMPIPDPMWKPGDSMDPVAPKLEKLPLIVVIIDEFADLMMTVGKDVEQLIARLAQKARAAGIHLILATQRPSVDIITGLIKANIPSRMAFKVSTKIDSRTILDQGGAESLLGMGDMLYLPVGASLPVRIHGAFVSDDEVHRVVNDWKARGRPNYIDAIVKGEQTADTLLPGETLSNGDELDEYYDQVVEFVSDVRKCSISSVQRRFRIGYNRSARIVEQLEREGVVSPASANGNREVLIPPFVE